MSKKIYIFIWVLSITAAYFTGKQMRDKNKADSSIQTNKDSIPDISQKKQLLRIERQSQSERRNKNNKLKRNLQTFALDMIDAHQIEDRYSRYRRLADIWDNLSEMNGEQILQLMGVIKDEDIELHTRQQINEMLQKKLISIDPAFAAKIASKGDSYKFLSDAVLAWSKLNPEETFQWMIKQEDTFYPYTFQAVFEQYASQDFDKAFEAIHSMQGKERLNALEGIINSCNDKDLFRKLAFSIDSLKNNSSELKSLAYRWAKLDPISAIAFAQTYKHNNELLSQVKKSWLQSQPNEAAEWIMSQANDKNKAVLEIISKWKLEESNKLLNFIDKQELTSNDESYSRFISRFKAQNLDVSLKLLDKIKNLDNRKRSAKELMESLSYLKSPENAIAFIDEREEFSNDEKAELKKNLPTPHNSIMVNGKVLNMNDVPEASERSVLTIPIPK